MLLLLPAADTVISVGETNLVLVDAEIAKLDYFRHKIAYCFKGIARKQKAKKKAMNINYKLLWINNH